MSSTTIFIRGFDPDALLRIVQGGLTEHFLPAPPARCHGVVERWRQDGVSVDRGLYAFDVAVCGTFQPDSICIGRAEPGISSVQVNGVAIAADQIQLYPENTEFVYRATGGVRWTAVQVRRDALQSAAEEVLGRPLALTAGHVSNLRVPSAARACIARAIECVLEAHDDARSHELADDEHALKDALLYSVVEAIDASTSDEAFLERQIRAHRRIRTVRAAQSLLRTVVDRPYDSLAISEALGVPQRTLQWTFRSTLGMSPRAWFNELRLHHAHHALCRASSARETVTGVAMRYGFAHLSRFAAEYKRLFGEFPSETLHRSNVPASRRHLRSTPALAHHLR